MSAAQSVQIVPVLALGGAGLHGPAPALAAAFAQLDDVIRRLDARHDERCLVTDAMLLEAYGTAYPKKARRLRHLAHDGQLEIGPGFYVTPDVNLAGGESLALQARVGKHWLAEHLGVGARVCWLAHDTGGGGGGGDVYPATLPQLLRQLGYDYFVCHGGRSGPFVWEGDDGTRIRAYRVAALGELHAPPGAPGAIVAVPSADAATIGSRVDDAPPRWATASEALDAVAWDAAPVVAGDVRAADPPGVLLNVRVAQRNRRLTQRLLALEAAAAVYNDRPADFADLWRLLLKHQFRQTIRGRLSDAALAAWEAEANRLEREMLLARHRVQNGRGGAGERWVAFNPLSFAQVKVVDARREKLTIPPLSSRDTDDAAVLVGYPEPVAPPATFANAFYRATIGADGHVQSLRHRPDGRELVRAAERDGAAAVPFGCVTLQPLARDGPAGPPVRPNVEVGTVIRFPGGDVQVFQEGALPVGDGAAVRFHTITRLRTHAPRIDYETRVFPRGRDYALHARFPTTLRAAAAVRRDEVPFGTEARDAAEHVTQAWADLADDARAVALLNTGTSLVAAADGVLALALLRAEAYAGDPAGTASFNENEPHTFRYAVLPHAPGDLLPVVREGRAMNGPPILCAVDPACLGDCGWGVEPAGVMLSALRWSGDRLFVRVYESLGAAARGRLRVPRRVAAYADADGLERATGPYRACAGEVPLALRAFEIKAFLLELA